MIRGSHNFSIKRLSGAKPPRTVTCSYTFRLLTYVAPETIIHALHRPSTTSFVTLILVSSKGHTRWAAGLGRVVTDTESISNTSNCASSNKGNAATATGGMRSITDPLYPPSRPLPETQLGQSCLKLRLS